MDENKQLFFEVFHLSLRLAPSNRHLIIASKSLGYLIATFNFTTDEWQDESKPICVLFEHNGKTYRKIIGVENGLQTNQCYVPLDVIDLDYFELSLYCSTTATNLITTNQVLIKVVDSGYTDDVIDETNPMVVNPELVYIDDLQLKEKLEEVYYGES